MCVKGELVSFPDMRGVGALRNFISRILCPSLLMYGLLPPLGFAPSSFDLRHTSAVTAAAQAVG